MILSKEQINRYLRHIIIPEISGPGQRKLFDATVTVLSESAEAAAPLLYYLAAVGIGKLNCVFTDNQGREMLFANLRDLNSDISVTTESNTREIMPDDLSCRIIFGQESYAAHNLFREFGSGSATIIAVNRGWEGYIQVLQPGEHMESTLSELQKLIYEMPIHNQMGSIFSSCLLGALTSIEVIKQMLSIGTSACNPLSFDLLTMSFENQNKNTPAASQFFKSEGAADQCKSISVDSVKNIETSSKSLADGKALIVGTGGLGSPAAYALVRAGIGTIGLVDYDTVDISNLNRQILHSTSRLGFPKVDSAEIFLHQLNPDVTIVKHNTDFNADNAAEIISGYDVIIDGVDNFSARYLLNDACYLSHKTMIEAGVSQFEGIGMTINPGHSMCYRCLFPQMPAPGTIPSCSETGVLGPVPGVMGFIEACEAAKVLTGQGTILTDTLLAFDALELSFEVLQTGKNEKCPLCGVNPTITELQNYEVRCDTSSTCLILDN